MMETQMEQHRMDFKCLNKQMDVNWIYGKRNQRENHSRKHRKINKRIFR